MIIQAKNGNYNKIKGYGRIIYPPLEFGSGPKPPLPPAIACLAAKPPAKSVNRTNATATIRELTFFMFFESPFNNSKEDFGVAYL